MGQGTQTTAKFSNRMAWRIRCDSRGIMMWIMERRWVGSDVGAYFKDGGLG